MYSLFEDEEKALLTTAEVPASNVLKVVEESPAVVCAAKGSYELPGNLETDIYIIPVSGGADSTALAIFLHERFPGVQFILVYTDTGAEEPAIYPALRRLEAFLGKKIEWLGEDKSLWDLISDYNGYLPSSSSRYCTRELKLRPFRKWLDQFKGVQKHMFVGIRADEPSRVAFTIDEVNTEMPFLDLGIGRAGVFQKLIETVGIPKFYSRRVRSGCSCCPFQRRQELVGLYQERPDEFEKGAAVEKLSPTDQQRHPPAPILSAECGLTENWMSLPPPAEGAVIAGRVGSKGDTLFNDRGVFVAAEFMYDAMPGYPPFIWKQRVISYSSSLAGITKQVNTRYAHLLGTAEANDMTPWDVRNQVKFAVYYIEASADVFDPAGTGVGSYTWHPSESYRQLAHVTGWATRVLHAHYIKEIGRKEETARPTSWLYEAARDYNQAMRAVTNEVGRVVASGWVKAQEPVDDGDFDEKTVACPMCSL